jgi:hypothetical protein
LFIKNQFEREKFVLFFHRKLKILKNPKNPQKTFLVGFLGGFFGFFWVGFLMVPVVGLPGAMRLGRTAGGGESPPPALLLFTSKYILI